MNAGVLAADEADAVTESVSCSASEAGVVEVTGAMTFATVGDLLPKSAALIHAEAPVRIDLTGVERVDSAGLALTVEWYRLARERRAPLEFVGQSEQMLELARTSNLQFLFESGGEGEASSAD